MTILLITILLIIIFILAAVCIHRSAQVSSLKEQVNFLEYNLEQLTEKEKVAEKNPMENKSMEDTAD